MFLCYSLYVTTLTIPKKEYDVLKQKAALYDALVKTTPHGVFDVQEKKELVTEENVLRWSRDARQLKKQGKLPLLRSLKEFR